LSIDIRPVHIRPEGLDTRDLIHAKSLLEDLRR